MHQLVQTEGQHLIKTGDYITNGDNGISVHHRCYLRAQHVACFKILGEFLHANVNKDITMVLKDRQAELMVQVAPNLYRKYITVDRKGTAILYVKMQNFLCGLLRSALLFYNKLVANLESDGFMLNPYDSCVANKVVDGKQMTVCWHVDNLKVSHCKVWSGHGHPPGKGPQLPPYDL